MCQRFLIERGIFLFFSHDFQTSHSRMEKQEHASLLLYLWSASETGNGILTENEIPLSLANVERRHETLRFDSYARI